MANSSARLIVATALMAAFPLLMYAQSNSEAVERKGQHAELKLERILTGNLTELNDRYKIRVALVTYDPGGFVGNHHHAGPGLRCVTKGHLTYVQAGETNVYGPGDCFYESGNVDHHAFNETDKSVELYNFQILPSEWSGSSAITVTPAPND